MRKETLSYHQTLYVLIVFLFGSSVVLGVNSEAGQDAWAALLIGMALAMIMALIYGRLIRLFPETGLFDMMHTLFGQVVGKVLTALFTWYALHLGALVMRNFSEFVQIVAMPETPQLPIMVLLMLVTAYLAVSGVKTLGKWAVITLPIIILVLLVTVLLSLNIMDYSNLLPALATKPLTLLKSGLNIFAFPFAETVVFLGMAGMIHRDQNPGRLYATAIPIGGGILLIVILRNLTVLGPALVQSSYFPSYTTARVIEVGDFLSRIEGTISINFLLAGITKISLCLMVASKGIACLFNLRDYRRIVMPTALLMMALCAVVYKNTMEMFGFLPYYAAYAMPFEVGIPLLVWIFAEIRRKRGKALTQGPSQA